MAIDNAVGESRGSASPFRHTSHEPVFCTPIFLISLIHSCWAARLKVSAPVHSLARMTIQIPVRMPTFMRVELTVDGHPDLDRAIELPTRSPRGWIVEAYRLSLGLEPHESADHDGIDHCHHEEAYAYPWPSVPGSDEIPGLPHEPAVLIRTIDTPPIGTPWLSVSSLSDASDPPAAGPSSGWLTGQAPFREDDVNRELLRRHGVVQPYFDDSDLWFVDPRLPMPSPIATLAALVTPARRLALLAHIDETDLLRTAAPDLHEAESALVPLTRLLDMLGADGMEQDAEKGWIPVAEIGRLVHSLGWDGTAAEARERGDRLVSFARRAKLIRRFRGKVVMTALARKVRVPSPLTLDRLAAMIMATESGWHDFRSTRVQAEEAIALLAIADGRAVHLDDLPDLVIEGSRALVESDVRVELDDGESPWARPARSRAAGAGGEIAAQLGLLSAAGAHGFVTPAMREVARLALVSGFTRHHYA